MFTLVMGTSRRRIPTGPLEFGVGPRVPQASGPVRRAIAHGRSASRWDLPQPLLRPVARPRCRTRQCRSGPPAAGCRRSAVRAFGVRDRRSCDGGTRSHRSGPPDHAHSGSWERPRATRQRRRRRSVHRCDPQALACTCSRRPRAGARRAGAGRRRSSPPSCAGRSSPNPVPHSPE